MKGVELSSNLKTLTCEMHFFVIDMDYENDLIKLVTFIFSLFCVNECYTESFLHVSGVTVLCISDKVKCP